MWYLNGGTLGPTDADLHLAKNGQIYTATQLKGFFLGDGHCMTMQKKEAPPRVHAMEHDPDSLQQSRCSVGVSPQDEKKGPWVMLKPNSQSKYLCLQTPEFAKEEAGTVPVLSQHSD